MARTMDQRQDQDQGQGPEPESIGDIIKRFKLLSIYLAYFVLVGVPMWLYTTSIYQSELPAYNEIDTLQKQVVGNLKIDIPVYIKLAKPFRYLIDETQQLVDTELQANGINLDEYHLQLTPIAMNAEVGANDYEIILKAAEDKDGNNLEESIYVSPFGRSAEVVYTEALVAHGKIPDFIMRVLVSHMFQEEIAYFGHSTTTTSNVAIPYSDHYNLQISLVVEDGKPIKWEIEKAIEQYFDNFIQSLSPLTNFTISTKVQYYCDFDLELAQENNTRVLDLQDLSTFVDLGGWNLVNQISLDPSINFVIYVPSSNLKIANSETNSFVIPQWGGVKVFEQPQENITSEELLPILEIFSSQLLALLSFPKTPKSLKIRMDIMQRITIRKNLQKAFDTLRSLIKLIDQLLEIPVPEETSKEVEQSLSYLRSFSTGNTMTHTTEQLLISNMAVKSSDRAFFRKEMIQQNYFPQAHKLTIYLPIAGPMLLILVNSLLRTIVEYKRARAVDANKKMV